MWTLCGSSQPLSGTFCNMLSASMTATPPELGGGEESTSQRCVIDFEIGVQNVADFGLVVGEIVESDQTTERGHVFARASARFRLDRSRRGHFWRYVSELRRVPVGVACRRRESIFHRSGKCDCSWRSVADRSALHRIRGRVCR